MQKGAMSTVHRFIILNLDHSRSIHKMVELLPRSKSDTTEKAPSFQTDKPLTPVAESLECQQEVQLAIAEIWGS